MEGVLDWILRDLLGEVGGLDRLVTEFVRVTDRLLPDHVFRRYCPELETGGRTRTGTPVFVQLLGGQPEWVAVNAARAAELGAPGIDLNFGCPARKVNQHDGGAALLRDPRRVFDVTSAVRSAVPAEVPVTVKVRLGFDHKDFRREIARAAAEAGAASLVVHARTKVEMYTPPAHWDHIRDMTAEVDIPLLANGDIWTVDDYRRCVDASGCTRVALGRGLVSDPLLAHRIRHAIDPAYVVPEFSRFEFLERFFTMSEAHAGEGFAVARAKQLLRYWKTSDPEYARWFEAVKVMRTADEVRVFLSGLRGPGSARWQSFTDPVAIECTRRLISTVCFESTYAHLPAAPRNRELRLSIKRVRWANK